MSAHASNLPAALQAWHQIVESRDPAGLTELIADDANFHSPAIHAPQEGKDLTVMYLTAAIAVLGPTLEYHRTWHDDSSAALEFKAELDGKTVHGIDIFNWNADGKIDSFTVMVRPFNGLQTVMAHMVAQLESTAS